MLSGKIKIDRKEKRKRRNSRIIETNGEIKINRSTIAKGKGNWNLDKDRWSERD